MNYNEKRKRILTFFIKNKNLIIREKKIQIEKNMKVKRPLDDLIKRNLTRQYSQDKYNKMKVIVIEQLQEYSRSGE